MSCVEELFPEHPACPIGTARGRLEELHHFWHEAERNYHDHRRFRASVNAAIQAARNVTFALQSDKAQIPDFDTWYEGWRDRLKDDPTMAWLHQARNVVVKKGDLEVHSLARASFKNWLDWPFGVVKVPPFLTAEGVIAYMMEKTIKLPSHPDDEAVLCVERRWVIADLPTRDLLEVLAHGFAVLSELVADGHARALQQGGNCPEMTFETVDSLPACMRASGAARTAYLHMKEKEPLDMEIRELPLDPQLAEEASKRYDIQAGSAPQVRTEDDVFNYAEWIVETGKRMLAADGRHHAQAFLIRPGERLKILGWDMPDQESKYVGLREVANEVERIGATAIILANEIWWIPRDKFDGRRAGLHPERKEAFMVVAETASGRFCRYTVPFERDAEGKITFGKTEANEDQSGAFTMEPFRSVWAKKRER